MHLQYAAHTIRSTAPGLGHVVRHVWAKVLTENARVDRPRGLVGGRGRIKGRSPVQLFGGALRSEVFGYYPVTVTHTPSSAAASGPGKRVRNFRLNATTTTLVPVVDQCLCRRTTTADGGVPSLLRGLAKLCCIIGLPGRDELPLGVTSYRSVVPAAYRPCAKSWSSVQNKPRTPLPLCTTCCGGC